MIVKLLTEHHLECLSLKEGCRASSESTLVKMPYCWKSHAAAQFLYACVSSRNLQNWDRLIPFLVKKCTQMRFCAYVSYAHDSMELSSVYYKGFPVKIYTKRCVTVHEDCFYLRKQCRPRYYILGFIVAKVSLEPSTGIEKTKPPRTAAHARSKGVICDKN